MARSSGGDGSRELAALGARLEAWRQRRTPGERIPEELWAAAAGLAAQLGVGRVAKRLRLGYYSLQERAARQGAAAPKAPAFVELPPLAPTPTPAPRPDCVVIELEHPSGARMRIELPAHSGALRSLAADFWSRP